jgi:hypothetical protein
MESILLPLILTEALNLGCAMLLIINTHQCLYAVLLVELQEQD